MIERRSKDGDLPQYYVHFVGQDRRLDEWVDAARLGPLPDIVPKISPPVAGGRIRRPIEKRPLTRPSRKADEVNTSNELASYDANAEKEHEESTRVKNIQTIEMGRCEVDAWYFSPFPEVFGEQRTLYVCEYTLKYMKSRAAFDAHLVEPRAQAAGQGDLPDARAAARQKRLGVGVGAAKGALGVGARRLGCKVYCQCLCLLAKLFLDHKTLYYDVDPFLFYVLCEVDAAGGHKMALLAKEKVSAEANNVACILVLPHHQRKGYGKLLIDVAYQITIREGAVALAEKPLSDLGQLSFRSYWTEVLLRTLQAHRGNLSIKELSAVTAIKMEDIISTLQAINCIRFWKGQHVISVAPKIVDDHLAKHYARASPREPARLARSRRPTEAEGGSEAARARTDRVEMRVIPVRAARAVAGELLGRRAHR